MATQVQTRRGTTAEHSTFTGAVGELTVDTTKDTVVVHDGSTVGGRALLREDQSNLPTSAPTTGLYNNSGALALSTNGQGRLFVDASGRVGVGTTPAQLLHISGSGAAYARIDGGSTSAVGVLFNNGDGAIYYDNNTDHLRFDTLGGEKVRITSAGLVGIGTGSPDERLTLGAAGKIKLNRSDNATGATIYNGGGLEGLIFNELNSEGYKFQNNGTTALRIDSLNRVGIGTTDASSLFSSSRNVKLSNTSGKVSYEAIVLDGTNNNRVGLFVDNGTGDLGLDTGSSSGAYNGLSFYIEGSKKATIDRTGRLLVGTSSARSTAFLASSYQVLLERNDFAGFSVYGNSPNQLGSYLGFGKSRGTTAGSVTSVVSGDFLGSLGFEGADGTSSVLAARIDCQVDGTPGTNDMPGRLVFSTTADGASSPTERMRITQAGISRFYGNVETAYFGTAQTSADTAAVVVVRHSATSTTNGTDCLYILPNGNVQNTNNSYGAISDIKLKENIVDANSQWDDIRALQVRNYNFKEGQTHTQIGLVAQEVELVSPGLVSESPDRDEDGNDLGTVTKSVNYSVLYMKAVKALQEAMERIETLEAKVAALESA